jgi:hypothetical protein
MWMPSLVWAYRIGGTVPESLPRRCASLSVEPGAR